VAQQAFLDQRRHLRPGRLADLLDGVERATDGEDGQPAEQPLLGRVEQRMAPGDRLPQRLLAGRQVTRAVGEQAEQAARLKGERDCRPGSSEVDPEREPVGLLEQSRVAASRD